jgi:glycosyltransferase involved in cell wall biosynthesis
MNSERVKIVFVQTTAASIGKLEKNGLLARQKKLLQQYQKHFRVEVFSSDDRDFSAELGTVHSKPPISIGIGGLHHLIYYIWLILRAGSVKGPILASGVSLPVLPILKKISGQRVVIYFKYDWGKGVKRDYGGVKALVSDFIQKWSIRSADVIICTAEWLRDIVRERYGLEAMVSPNFVDEEVFYPAPNKGESIIYSGRLHWSKGVNTLIEAFAMLEKKLPQVRLLICGQGEDRERFRLLAASTGARNIEFLGLVDQARLGRLTAESKAFVLPTSTMEGHPKALIEAMACGTACVASDVPGNHHIIKDMINGMLFPPGNKEKLFAILNTLFHDDMLRMSLEKEAAEFAKKHFGFESVVSREIAIIQSVSR